MLFFRPHRSGIININSLIRNGAIKMSKPVRCVACGKIDENHTLYNSELHDDERFQMLVTSDGINPTLCFECYDELLEITARLYKLFHEDTEQMIDLLSRSDILHCLESKLCL